MKKFFTILVSAIVFSFAVNAQEVALPKGSSVINAGVGFTTSYSNIVIPPIYVQYEYMVAEFGKKWGVGVGALGGFIAQKENKSLSMGGGLCALGDVHFSPIQQLDIYGGMFAGYVAVAVESIKAGIFTWGGILGARYFFTDTFGVNLQIGGMGVINVGVSFRF